MGESQPHAETVRKLAALTDIKAIAEAAGIPTAAVCDPMVNAVCGPFECEWVRGHFSADYTALSGLLYTGASTTVDVRMNALVGCFIRNFIDARKMTVSRLIADVEAGSSPECTVLCLPDFLAEKTGAMEPAQIERLYDLLVSRGSQERKTLLYVPSLDEARTAYGSDIADFLSTHFVPVTGEDVPTA